MAGKLLTQTTLELCNVQPHVLGAYICIAQSGSTLDQMDTTIASGCNT